MSREIEGQIGMMKHRGEVAIFSTVVTMLNGHVMILLGEPKSAVKLLRTFADMVEKKEQDGPEAVIVPPMGWKPPEDKPS